MRRLLGQPERPAKLHCRLINPPVTPEELMNSVDIPDTLPLDRLPNAIAGQVSGAFCAGAGMALPRRLTRWIDVGEGDA
jgi:hypothetical protein